MDFSSLTCSVVGAGPHAGLRATKAPAAAAAAKAPAAEAPAVPQVCISIPIKRDNVQSASAFTALEVTASCKGEKFGNSGISCKLVDGYYNSIANVNFKVLKSVNTRLGSTTQSATASAALARNALPQDVRTVESDPDTACTDQARWRVDRGQLYFNFTVPTARASNEVRAAADRLRTMK